LKESEVCVFAGNCCGGCDVAVVDVVRVSDRRQLSALSAAETDREGGLEGGGRCDESNSGRVLLKRKQSAKCSVSGNFQCTKEVK
jgi:hypothetical protein